MELQKILYGLANTELFRQSHYKNYFALLSHYSTTDHFGSWKSPQKFKTVTSVQFKPGSFSKNFAIRAPSPSQTVIHSFKQTSSLSNSNLFLYNSQLSHLFKKRITQSPIRLDSRVNMLWLFVKIER